MSVFCRKGSEALLGRLSGRPAIRVAIHFRPSGSTLQPVAARLTGMLAEATLPHR